MRYEIRGELMQTLNMELEEGEYVLSDAGRLAWMSDNIEMDIIQSGGLIGGLKRSIIRESFFLARFRCRGRSGFVSFASSFPGRILAVKLNGSIICQKRAFLSSTPGIRLGLYLRRNMGVGFFGGEGFAMEKLSGGGMVFLEIDGEVTVVNLKRGESLKVATGHIAMFEPSVSFEVEPIKRATNILFAREGLFLARVKGPGRVWLQSMPAENFVKALNKRGVK